MQKKLQSQLAPRSYSRLPCYMQHSTPWLCLKTMSLKNKTELVHNCPFPRLQKLLLEIQTQLSLEFRRL